MTAFTDPRTQTLDQRRAAHAWKIVQEAKTSPDPKKFGSQAKKLPSRIVAAGLGNALAFLNAKNYAPLLLQAILDWVLDKRNNPSSTKGLPAINELNARIREIMNRDSFFLRWATDETLAYLQWLNRFADAEGITEETEEEATT